MRLVLRSSGVDRELDLELRSPGATVEDLLRAVLGPNHSGPVAVGDRELPAWSVLAEAGLHDGAVVSLAGDGVPAPAPLVGPKDLELVILSGMEAGRTYPLGVGTSSIGREGASIVLGHSTVSARHCEIEVAPSGTCTLTDVGSSNGTFVDGRRLAAGERVAVEPQSVVEVGVLAIAVRPPQDADRPRALDIRRQVGPAGTLPFNRPPRAPLTLAPGPVEVPSEARAPEKPHFSIAATVGPLVLAVVMIMVTGDIRFAMFALLSPLIAVGQYAESRRRSTKGGARSRREYDAAVQELERDIAERAVAERARRRGLLPDPPEVLRRAALPSVRLWERRPHQEDFLQIFAGLADLPWQPAVKDAGSRRAPEVAAALAAGEVRAAPLGVDLSGGGVVGVVGERAAALATARSLVCQAAVHHGPADVTIGVFVDPGREPDWDWCKWLPHVRRGAGAEQWLAAGREHSEPLLRELLAGAATGTALVVLDSDVLTEGKNAPARDLLSGVGSLRDETGRRVKVPVAGIVVASTTDRLPAACNTIIEIVDAEGGATVRFTDGRMDVDDVVLAGSTIARARDCARNLARFEDPELRQPGAGLPDMVRLLPLLELERVDAASIRERWQRTEPGAAPVAPLGVTERGVFSLDLVRDGPHGLIGGTTGSGKSELLRSLVAGLAACADPTQLTFVLIDYKGGAAFDECARLPHTVGMVTDLDAQLGERALLALDAEVRYRERRLRDAGVDNLRDYQVLGRGEPLPRLLVVIDEFATMAKDLPEFLSALVSVAQRGRTLGVHLLLATQRPSGAVNENIKTNTNLRIALRVQDPGDSTDVIGTRDAAELSRHQPGRAYVRLGPAEIVPIQTALVTCVSGERVDGAVDVAPFVFGPRSRERQGAADGAAGAGAPGPSDLTRLVDAIAEANRTQGLPAVRRPWPEPLGRHVDLAELAAAGAATGPAAENGEVLVALADDPARQTQYPVGWRLREGNLLLYGIAGSGTTGALASLAITLAAAHSPQQLELYVFDYGAGDLAPLQRLPHTGAVVLAAERERQVRLIRHLRAELDRRRAGEGDGQVVVLIDNIAAMRAEFGDAEGLDLMDELTRVYADGTEVGIRFAVAADRLNGVHGSWSSVTQQKWLFRLPDAHDYAAAGLTRKHRPQAVAGRAVMAPGGLQIQVGRPLPSVADAVASIAASYSHQPRRARSIGALPARVALRSLDAVSRLSQEPWRIPIGIRESDLEVAELVLYEGEHALVAGPPRSGKSSALCTIARSLRSGGTDVHLAGAGGRRSALSACPALDRYAGAGGEASALFAALRSVPGPVVLFVDDAEAFEDVDEAIQGLLAAARPDLHVIAAGRSDSLRSLYRHWTQTVRRSKNGLLLRPNIDMDGELAGVTLPRRSPVPMVVGRGYLAQNGELEIVQVATGEGDA
ncbi:MAG: FtsK/SpoIIIE domain-containing protein [Solirubrobacteraceae bacterium]